MKRRSVWRSLIRVPIVGEFLRIANAYAFRGDDRNSRVPAQLRDWWGRIVRRVLGVLILEGLLLLAAVPFDLEPSQLARCTDLALGIFPDLLGFGVGIYALIFVFPKTFTPLLEKRRAEVGFGAEIVNVDIGYPVAVLAIGLVVASALTLFPQGWTTGALGLFVLLYGLAMVFELLAFLFVTLQVIIKHEKKEHQARIANNKDGSY